MMLHVANRPRLLLKATLATFLICLLPWILSLGGVDFGTPGEALNLDHWQTLSKLELTDRLHHALEGSFTHTLLEWSAVSTAIFTAILALIHYAFNRDVVTPIIGMVMFYAGCMDAFHTLAADRLIEGVADYQTLIPFTWAICRLFSALTILLGALFFLRRSQGSLQGGMVLIALASLLLGAIAYLTVQWCANTAALPQTLFPNSPIARPWDVY
ncbi:MAG: MASE3 domain-containing protein, partial [Pseudanabaenaceae cyanobacterium]